MVIKHWFFCQSLCTPRPWRLGAAASHYSPPLSWLLFPLEGRKSPLSSCHPPFFPSRRQRRRLFLVSLPPFLNTNFSIGRLQLLSEFKQQKPARTGLLPKVKLPKANPRLQPRSKARKEYIALSCSWTLGLCLCFEFLKLFFSHKAIACYDFVLFSPPVQHLYLIIQWICDSRCFSICLRLPRKKKSPY